MSVICADSIRVMQPLFQTAEGGSTPTSALQLFVEPIDRRHAADLVKAWHSRLPDIGNWRFCTCYAATWCNRVYAVAMWSTPTAIAFNGKGVFELRRMAIADDAPKNTASRMLRVMVAMIRKARPHLKRLISYQDTEVHKGTIYKASGWVATRVSKAGEQNWAATHPRPGKVHSAASKVRWEYILN